MITICWDGHRFEYLQDQIQCPECGEYPQFMERKYKPGERERLQKIVEERREEQKNDYDGGYKRGFMEGFEKGILAEEKRQEDETKKEKIPT